tara:strand:- start:70 stop:1428 length:1359 start_codon:yes stop_codon:yes gene_type:complete
MGRDYKDEYKKFQSSTKSKKYRAELNKYNRNNGKYGNGDGKDASHKNGKISGYESESTNRGRKTVSMKKKSYKDGGKTFKSEFKRGASETIGRIIGTGVPTKAAKKKASAKKIAKMTREGIMEAAQAGSIVGAKAWQKKKSAKATPLPDKGKAKIKKIGKAPKKSNIKATPAMKKGGKIYKKTGTGKGGKLETKAVKAIHKGVGKAEKVMGIDPKNTDKQDLGVIGGAMAGGAAGSALGPLGTLAGIVGGARAGKKLMTKKKAKKKMKTGGEVKFKGKQKKVTPLSQKHLSGTVIKQMRGGPKIKVKDTRSKERRWIESAPPGERSSHEYKQMQSGYKGGRKLPLSKAAIEKMDRKVDIEHFKKWDFPGSRIDATPKWVKEDNRPSVYGKKAMLGREAAKLVKDREHGGDIPKPAKYKDGGAVRVSERSVHKAAGDPVTTYQASNSNYKEGK